MSAGVAPPSRIFRVFLALVAAVAIALVLPGVQMTARAGTPAVADDDDGGKKKDRDSKKSDDDEDSSKHDDDDDDDDGDGDEDDSPSKKGKKSDDEDDDSDDADSDDEDSDDDEDSGSKDDDDEADSEGESDGERSGAVLARSSEEPTRGGADDAQVVEPAPKAVPAAPVTPAAAVTSLLASGNYMPMADAIERARKAGGQGDVLQIDLEFDAFRGFATCDVTFSSGTEYEMNAETGEILGEKQKDPRKLALLAALSTDQKSLKSFTDIIDQVSKATGQAVLEMELKHLKGQPGVVFEVVTADGITTHFDAATGQSAAMP